MGCIESFRRQDARTKRKYVAIFVASVIGLTALIMIILVVAVPKPKQLFSAEKDRIACPGQYSPKDCKAHLCTYDPVSFGPSCYMKRRDFGYKVKETSADKMKVTLEARTDKTPFGPSITNVNFDISYITENIVRIKMYDSKQARYEVPVQNDFPLLKNRPSVDVKKLAYNVSVVQNDPFAYQVQRSDGTVLWDTSIGGLVMSDQYLQVASYLPSENIYGIGEHYHLTLKHDLDFQTWPLFARDHSPVRGKQNLYGAHPFYTCLENTTRSHGVLLLNSNAMEVTLMPKPAISFRTIGGILDLFYFVGDNPEHVVQLYTSLIGRPMMPPYWGLGFQLSRYGYNKLENVKKAIERTRNASIAQDVQFLDIDHMFKRRDFTYDNESFADLIDYIKKTKDEYDLKWIIIIDPAIEAVNGYEPYDEGMQKKVFIKRPSNWKADMFPPEVQKEEFVYGKVWPDNVVAFPDFLNKNTHDWWIKTIVEYHKTLPFDGLWIDMNEPANFGTNEKQPFYCPSAKNCWSLKCPKSDFDDPPYNPLNNFDARLSKMTLCMDSVQNDGTKNISHYNVHNLYGWSQSEPTIRAAEMATGTRSLVISRSTYPSSGRHVGHWLGDNYSTWNDMKFSIIGLLEFNLFGIPYIGADVCGFNDDTTEELCLRWMQLGAFYPFFRNHNGMGQKEQDPAKLGPDVEKASRNAVERRYELQPYLYTLFYHAHVDGSTVIRPLFHEFPSDENTTNNAEQFMWGGCLLVSPILRQGAKSVQLYLPPGEKTREKWFTFNFNQSKGEERVGFIEAGDASGTIPVHVRAGCVIPTEPYVLKGVPKNKTLELHVFLNNGYAKGELFIDDGISKDTIEKKNYNLFTFVASNCIFEVKKELGEYNGEYPLLSKVHFYQSHFGKDHPYDEAGHTLIDKKLNEVTRIDVNIASCQKTSTTP